MKAQRHPEYYVPGWASNGLELPDDADPAAYPQLRVPALAMVTEVVRHTASSPAIDAWQAENEPFIPSGRAGYWRLGREYVQQVIAEIRANDPLGRPVAENQDDHILFRQRWRYSLQDSDIVAMSVFPFRPTTVLAWDFVMDILQWGWLAPNYPDHARETRGEGKRYWLTEMQAEPWADPDVRLYGPRNLPPDFPPPNLAKNLQYARRSGASRVYLWGAEWWLYERAHQGDGRYWEIAQAALSASP
jgi:hypothetical protein